MDQTLALRVEELVPHGVFALPLQPSSDVVAVDGNAGQDFVE
ncbi:hypothetical protein [Streptomyces sp. NEAU-S7GS2]|nr:hypothetical protein [Streptomyces sp. NEAU-S7GS2]